MNSSRYRLHLLAASGILLVGGTMGSAAAQTQYPITPPPAVVLTPTTVAAAGATVTVPGAAPAVTAAPATTPATVPAAAAATTVAPAAAPAAEVLGETITANPAFTGSNATKPFAFAGMALVATGGAFVVASRRRRRPQA